MSRPLRIEYSGAWYHVMNRGRRGDNIFCEAADYKKFIELCIESIELWNIKIGGYCLMSNHYHLLIKTPDANLSRAMRHINGVYTQKYNRKYNVDGQLFRGRYKAVLVSNDKYLLEVLRYIHRNPITANIVSKIDKYEWSSHNGYMSYAKKWDWLYKDYLLRFFSKNRNYSVKKYREFIRKKEMEETIKFYSEKNTLPVLGPQEYLDWVKRTYHGKSKDLEITDNKSLSPSEKEIIEEICIEYEVSRSELFKSRRGQNNEARNVTVYLLRHLRSEPLNKICEIMKLKRYSSASSIIIRVKENILKNKSIKKKISKIKMKIIKSQE